MANYKEVLAEGSPEWPYPVRYGKENKISADILVLGGGIAGCHAAINAAKRGARVVVVDKGPVIRSGAGGAGVDHWHAVYTSPCSKISPEEMMELVKDFGDYDYGEYGIGITCYILCKESYDTLLDVEQMGVKIRDVDDEFVGAPFRDEKTKLMFAYDYENKHCIRIQGANVKPALYNELKRLGVEIYDHVMATSLLTEGGKQGSRVVGATGLNVRTGEFYIFKAKATILTAGQARGLWIFNTELLGADTSHGDPNCAGDGHAMAWQAGAEFTMMERSVPSLGSFHYPDHGAGGAHNTWYPCTIVDSNGKEIPWVDRDGKVIKTVEERCRPAPGQKFFVLTPGTPPYEIRGPCLIPDLPERIRKGEFVLPLYADLPSMPEHERRAIFGLMVGHEGKTRIPVYETYTKAGFDPDQDLLQVTMLSPHAYTFGPWFDSMEMAPQQWRETGFINGGGVVVDWDLKTNLEGLYAAGNQLAGGGDHAAAATTGRYAARKATKYAQTATEPVIDRRQVDEEKARVYAPVNRKDGIGWKELYAGISRIMQDYCGEYKGEETLKMGLKWLDSIRESEASRACVRNPHELWRTLECMVRLTVGKMIMQASLARRASSKALGFKRLDYPEIDALEWNKYVTTKLENGELKVGEMPFNYWLLPPNAPTYQENYDKHCGL
ncbi:Adenylylsulfate reductase subunit alpha [subsurface metagenome]